MTIGLVTDDRRFGRDREADAGSCPSIVKSRVALTIRLLVVPEVAPDHLAPALKGAIEKVLPTISCRSLPAVLPQHALEPGSNDGQNLLRGRDRLGLIFFEVADLRDTCPEPRGESPSTQALATSPGNSRG